MSGVEWSAGRVCGFLGLVGWISASAAGCCSVWFGQRDGYEGG